MYLKNSKINGNNNTWLGFFFIVTIIINNKINETSVLANKSKNSIFNEKKFSIR